MVTTPEMQPQQPNIAAVHLAAEMETKAQVERVVDDGRRINQVVARGKYGTDVARLWATLRNGINDLARAYNVAPLGV